MNNRAVKAVALALLVGATLGMKYDAAQAAAFARKWGLHKNLPGGYTYRYRGGAPFDCVKFVSTAAREGGLLPPEKLRPIRDWNEIIRARKHKQAKHPVD